METLLDSHLKSFLKQPTLIKAKQAFITCHDKGLPVPEEIARFLAEAFRKDIASRSNKPESRHQTIDRSVLVELMIRIAKSRDGESIDSICQMVANESGIQGNKTNTAGEILRKGMEEFRQRSKVNRNQ